MTGLEKCNYQSCPSVVANFFFVKRHTLVNLLNIALRNA